MARMAFGPANGNKIYFTKDHDMVRCAVSDFVKKEINPYVDRWEEDRKSSGQEWGFSAAPHIFTIG